MKLAILALLSVSTLTAFAAPAPAMRTGNDKDAIETIMNSIHFDLSGVKLLNANDPSLAVERANHKESFLYELPGASCWVIVETADSIKAGIVVKRYVDAGIALVVASEFFSTDRKEEIGK